MFATVGKRPVSALERAALRLIRHSSRAPDYDGLVSSFKFLIDPLVRLGIIANDTMDIIGIPSYEWQKTKSGSGYVEVFIEERDTIKK